MIRTINTLNRELEEEFGTTTVWLPVANQRPSGLKATLSVQPISSCTVVKASPVAMDQTLNSPDPVHINC